MNNESFFKTFIFRIRHVENRKETVITIFDRWMMKTVSNRTSIMFFSNIFIIKKYFYMTDDKHFLRKKMEVSVYKHIYYSIR